MKNVVPLKKEQQKTQKCHSFEKGTIEIKNMLRLWKRDSEHSAVPFLLKKEQEKSKCCSF